MPIRAYDYVDMTDSDVEKFIEIAKEARFALFENNNEIYLDNMLKKHNAEYTSTDNKMHVLFAGLFTAIELVDPDVFVKYTKLKDRRAAVFSHFLEKSGVDSRDAIVMASHENDFIQAAMYVILLGNNKD